MGGKKIFPYLLLTLKNKNLQEIPEREKSLLPWNGNWTSCRTEQGREELVTILGNSQLYLEHFSNV